jgi:hypothetical protein
MSKLNPQPTMEIIRVQPIPNVNKYVQGLIVRGSLCKILRSTPTTVYFYLAYGPQHWNIHNKHEFDFHKVYWHFTNRKNSIFVCSLDLVSTDNCFESTKIEDALQRCVNKIQDENIPVYAFRE